jgi:hypothetical protein
MGKKTSYRWVDIVQVDRHHTGKQTCKKAGIIQADRHNIGRQTSGRLPDII